MHYIGLDVHKETIAVAIAPDKTGEVRHYGIIGGTLAAVDKLIKNSPRPTWSCALNPETTMKKSLLRTEAERSHGGLKADDVRALNHVREREKAEIAIFILGTARA